MSIESGQQVLPTDGFDDFADETQEETAAFANQINEDQEINDDNVATLELDDSEGPDDVDTGTEGDDSEAAEKAETETAEDVDEDADEADANESEAAEAAEAAEDKQDVAKPEDTYTKKEKFEKYSRSVQRRISKEIKQREILRTENEALKNRLDSIENKLQKETQDSEANVLANRIRNATSIKQQLMEDAEYDQVAQVDNDIMQMKIMQAKMEERAQQGQYTDPNTAESDKAEAPQEPAPNKEPIDVPEAQTQWIKNNDQFGKNKPFTAYVNATYDMLLEEGYDPEDESMYKELDVRTNNIPVAAKPTPTPKPKPTSKPRPQSAPTPNVGQAQRTAASKNTITEADKINMKNWGLDSTDKAVRQEWLKNKQGKK